MRYILPLLLFLCMMAQAQMEEESKTTPSKEIYLSYSQYPKRVFTGQKFQVELKAIIVKSRTSYDDIITTLGEGESIEILTQNIQWNEELDGSYTAKLQFKADDKPFVLPQVTMALLKNGQVIDHAKLLPISIEYEQIAINQSLFSNIIAKDIKVNNVTTKQYSNTQLHTTLHIEGIESNLEDIYLRSYGDQGTSSLVEDSQKQSLYYYVITPIHIKEITFSYYNTVENSFIKIELPIILEEELVSTQTELNPYYNSMLLYKQIALGVVLGVFLILYAFQRDLIYLIIVTILIIILAYMFIPNEKILLEEGVKVYILPTSNSTVYKTLENKEIVEKVYIENGFVKIIFSNDIVGWIKQSDL